MGFAKCISLGNLEINFMKNVFFNSIEGAMHKLGQECSFKIDLDWSKCLVTIWWQLTYIVIIRGLRDIVLGASID